MLIDPYDLTMCFFVLSTLARSSHFLSQESIVYQFTLPETNIAPENGWLEY